MKENKKLTKKKEIKKVNIEENQPLIDLNLTDEEYLKQMNLKAKQERKSQRKKRAIKLVVGTIGLATSIAVPIVYYETRPIVLTISMSSDKKDKYQIKVRKGTKIKDIEIVQLEGYTFIGFYKDEDCTQKYHPSKLITKDMTIYAGYQKLEYKIDIPSNEAYFIDNSSTMVDWGDDFRFKFYEREGYDISEIKVYVNGVEIFPDVNRYYTITNITEDKTIRVEGYKRQVSLTLNINGEIEQYTISSNITLANILQSVSTEYNEHNTAGWFTDENLYYPADLNAELTQSVTLYTKEATLDKLFFTSISGGSAYAVSKSSEDITGEVVLPSCYNGKPVTLTASDAFWKCHDITSVVLCANLKIINSCTFQNCDNLVEVNMVHGIEQIGSFGFYDCYKLNKLVLPATLTKCHNAGFYNLYNLAEVYNLSDLEITFSNTGSSKVVIHNSLDEESVIYQEGCAYYYNFEDEKVLIRVETDSDYFEVAEGTTIINSYVFNKMQNLIKVKMGDSVKEIKNYAFESSYNIVSVILSKNLETVSSSSFSGCYRLVEVYNPSSKSVYIQNKLVEYKDLSEPSLLEKDDNGNYYLSLNGEYILVSGTQNEKCVIKNETTIINSFAFYGNRNVRSVYIPKSVKQIKDYVFDSCENLQSCVFEENSELTTIGDCLFQSCNKLESFIMPDTITTIGSRCFWECTSLKEVKLSSNLKILDQYFFYKCESLEEITIPASVASIFYDCFSGCTNLKTVNIEENSKLYVLEQDAFKDCVSLERFVIPNSVTKIGHSCFSGCTGLKEIVLSAGLTGTSAINTTAFTGCVNLEKVVIPETITKITSSIFKDCVNLKYVELNAQEGYRWKTSASHYIDTLDMEKICEYIRQYTFTQVAA